GELSRHLLAVDYVAAKDHVVAVEEDHYDRGFADIETGRKVNERVPVAVFLVLPVDHAGARGGVPNARSIDDVEEGNFLVRNDAAIRESRISEIDEGHLCLGRRGTVPRMLGRAAAPRRQNYRASDHHGGDPRVALRSMLPTRAAHAGT